MISESLEVNIPKPILFPNELLLKLTPIRKCLLKPDFNINSLSILLENIFEFFDEKNNVNTYQYCLVYLTTLRIIFVPFSKDVNNFKLSNCFSLPIKQIEKCHIEKYQNNNSYSVFIKFYLLTSNYDIEVSSLQIKSNSKKRIIDIASLISAIRYASSVGKNLPLVSRSSEVSGNYDYEIIGNLDSGYELFYHQLDPKLQSMHGINSFVNYDDHLNDEYLPSYEESEKSVGHFFKKQGLLNQIVIRDSNYLETLQNLNNHPGNAFDYYYDNDLNSEFRPFLFLDRENSDSQFGNYYYKFLAENALRYSERNIDDIVQVIYDNLHHQDSNTIERINSVSSTNNRISSNFTQLLNSTTILDASTLQLNEEIEQEQPLTNNTTNPARNHHVAMAPSIGNIQDLIAVDADTNVEDQRRERDLTALSVITDEFSEEISDSNDLVDFLTSEGYSRITRYLDQEDLDQINFQDNNIGSDEHYRSLDPNTGNSLELLAKLPEQSTLLQADTLQSGVFADAASFPGDLSFKNLTSFSLHNFDIQVIPNTLVDSLISHSDIIGDGSLLPKDSSPENSARQSSFSIQFNDIDSETPTNQNTSNFFEEEVTFEESNTSGIASANGVELSASSTPPTNAPSTVSDSNDRIFPNHQPTRKHLHLEIPNSDFVLNNNKFLENAVDQSHFTYLSHKKLQTVPDTAAGSCSPNIYSPTSIKGLKNFSILNSEAKAVKQKSSAPQLRRSVLYASTHSMRNLLDSIKEASPEPKKIKSKFQNINNHVSGNVQKFKNNVVASAVNLPATHTAHLPATYTANISPADAGATTPAKPKTNDNSKRFSISLDNLFHQRTDSGTSSGPSIDNSSYYYDPENPYSDIINNRMKYHAIKHQKMMKKQEKLETEKSEKFKKSLKPEKLQRSKIHTLRTSISDMHLKKFFS